MRLCSDRQSANNEAQGVFQRDSWLPAEHVADAVTVTHRDRDIGLAASVEGQAQQKYPRYFG